MYVCVYGVVVMLICLCYVLRIRWTDNATLAPHSSYGDDMNNYVLIELQTHKGDL